MKQKAKNKYKIKLGGGTIYLDRGEMGAVLIEKKLNFWIGGKNYEDLGMALLYSWQGYQSYTDESLIDEIHECFFDPKQIKKLLRIQNKRLEKEHAEWAKQGKKLLKEMGIFKKQFS